MGEFYSLFLLYPFFEISLVIVPRVLEITLRIVTCTFVTTQVDRLKAEGF